MEDSEKILDVAEPVAEVTEEVADVVETPQNDDVEFTDTSNNNQNNSQEEIIEEKEEEKVQTPEENANYAQIRRKAEEDANKRIETEKQKAYNEGRLAAYKGKVNPYTEKPIVDLTDIEMYEMMYQLENEGKDPIKDLPEEFAKKRREEERVIQEKKELEEKTKKEVEDFNNKYPDVNLNELLKDSLFVDYIQGKNKPITELYDGFNNIKNAFRNSAVNVAKQTIANAQASPGALGSEAEVTVDYSTMSSEEFQRAAQAVIDGELK